MSATGPGPRFRVSCGSADTLRTGYLFWPTAMSEKAMFLLSVSGITQQGQKCSKTNEERLRALTPYELLLYRDAPH